GERIPRGEEQRGKDGGQIAIQPVVVPLHRVAYHPGQYRSPHTGRPPRLLGHVCLGCQHLWHLGYPPALRTDPSVSQTAFSPPSRAWAIVVVVFNAKSGAKSRHDLLGFFSRPANLTGVRRIPRRIL